MTKPARRRQIRFRAAYETSGGLHGLGVSVVNRCRRASKSRFARSQTLYRQPSSAACRSPSSKWSARRQPPRHARALHPTSKFSARRCTSTGAAVQDERAKAYLFGGVEIRWRCAPSLLAATARSPPSDLPFPRRPEGLSRRRHRGSGAGRRPGVYRQVEKDGKHGSVEWAIAWTAFEDGFVHSYCNTIPTPDGGTHEAGLRAALLRGLKTRRAHRHSKRAAALTTDDVMNGCAAMISVFIPRAGFQGQNKGRLQTAEAARIVDAAVRARSTIGSPPRREQAAAARLRHRRGGARAPAEWRRTSPARRRRASCAARQAR